MGEAFRDRLRRIRRDAPEQGPAPIGLPGRTELPVWLRARLARGASAAPAPSSARRTVGEPGGLIELQGPSGAYRARESVYPRSAHHGRYELGAALDLEPGTLALLSRGDLPQVLEVERAVFLDIETTGLSGGAGTHSFLVGLGWFEPAGFRVRQAFLRGPEEERAVLAACAQRLRQARLVVSFFGKSFDRHRLEDKMRVHGVAPPFEGTPHADLYWPCRRLYGAVTPDTRLATMETLLAGFEREGDLPGAFAPAAWLDFLGGRAHLLEEVFRHNLHDILSLVALLAHLGRATAEERSHDGGDELYRARARALAQLHLERKEGPSALAWLQRARGGPAAADRSLDLLEARALVRCGRRPEALSALLRAADDARDALAAQALIEAACASRRLGRPPEEIEALAARGLELARITTSGTLRARLERAAASACRPGRGSGRSR